MTPTEAAISASSAAAEIYYMPNLVLVSAAATGLVLVFSWLLWLQNSWSSRGVGPASGTKRVLLVTAHPDDESMFFAPTILALLRGGCQLHLLCLSAGGEEGPKRKAELAAACKLLGLDQSNIIVIEHSRLPDGQSVDWNSNLIGRLIATRLRQIEADTLLTFDKHGVSGHPNHKAIFFAIYHLFYKGKLPKDTQVLLLESVSLLRKYSGLLDLLFSRLSLAPFCYVSSREETALAREAMSAHGSQMVWFRRLYIFFSRYMLVNTLRRIAVDKQLHRRQQGHSNSSSDNDQLP